MERDEETAALVYGPEDRPAAGPLVLAALQHLLAVFLAIVTPPLLIAGALGIPDQGTVAYLVSMALVTSGIGTFIQCRGIGPFGARLLSVQGTSFAFCAPLIAIGLAAQAEAAKSGLAASEIAYGLPLLFGCAMCAASVEIVAAFLFRFLRKIVTPVVSGTVVALIGFCLIREGVVDCGGGHAAQSGLGDFPFASWRYLAVSGVTFMTIAVLSLSRSARLRMLSVLAGLAAGGVAAACLGMWRFSPAELPLVHVPHPLRWGLKIDGGACLSLGIVYLVTAIEATGDITATTLVSRLPLGDEAYCRRVKGGVLAGGVLSFFAGALNAFPCAIFAQNNGLIQLTGVASRRVGYALAAFLVVLGLLPPVGRLFAALPAPVLGGATLLMFGMVAAAGIRIIASQPIGRDETLVLALSLAACLGVELCPDVLAAAPACFRRIFSSGLVAGSCVALLANAIVQFERTCHERT